MLSQLSIYYYFTNQNFFLTPIFLFVYMPKHMTETNKKVYDQRLVDANLKTTEELHPSNRNGKTNNNQKRIRKKCVGCCDHFTCSQSKNYDYCKNCELNGSRYITKSNKCPECGDGSGLIKFPHQPPRTCKLCYLAHQKREEKFFTK